MTSDSSNTDQSSPSTLVNSSAIIGYTYDAEGYELTVYYKGKSQAVRVFKDIMPPEVSDIFDSGGSIGKKAIKMLKGKKGSDA